MSKNKDVNYKTVSEKYCLKTMDGKDAWEEGMLSAGLQTGSDTELRIMKEKP